MKKIILLGATGSIGRQTIEVIRKENHELVAISCYNNLNLALEIIKEFKTISAVSVKSELEKKTVEKEFPNVEVFFGNEGLIKLVKNFQNLTLVNALVGSVGAIPTIEAIKNHHDILLANKETMVIAGSKIFELAKANQVSLIPIDSEHTSVLMGLQKDLEIEEIIITASGGSFRDRSLDELKEVSVEEALNHPNWQMGKKITIDSATMFNKCLEIVECHYFFDIDMDRIKTVLHKESLVHAIIKYKSGFYAMIISNNDMKIFISYALNYPNKVNNQFLDFDFDKMFKLEFKPMDLERFPLVKLTIDIMKEDKNKMIVLNSINDALVELFLAKKISFLDITDIMISEIAKITLAKDISLEMLIEYSEVVYKKIIERYW